MLALLERVHRYQRTLARWLPPETRGQTTTALPTLHPSQRQVVAEAKRFNVVCCGRRWGKTTLGVDRLIAAALAGRPAGWFSPTYKMLADVWRDTRRALRGVTLSKSEQQHRLELVGGGVIEMWSLDEPDAARGRRYARVVIDEAAMVRDLNEAWNAVIRPALTDYAGDAWFLSTPRGRNYFWELYQRGVAGARGEWRSWQMPTSSNPYIAPAEIEAARLELPERVFAQEYLAQFLEDGGGVFRRVRECVRADAWRDAPESGHAYVIGVDWGRSDDFTVAVVLDEHTRAVVALDRFNQVDYTLQRDRLRALAERFGAHTIVAESNSIGQPNIEMLRRDGLPVRPFLTTNASKANAIEALALAFERREIVIPDDPVLLNELLAFSQERLPSGLMRYGAPAGGHDDCVMALAMAWQAASRPRRDARSYQG